MTRPTQCVSNEGIVVLETTRYKIYADLKDGVGVRFIKTRIGKSKSKADAEVDRLIHGKTAASRAYAIAQ